MSAAHGKVDGRGARRRVRRGLLAEAALTLAVLALAALPLVGAREATAQAVYYDQFGQPVTLPPGTAVVPVAPAPAAPASGYYGPAGAVSQTRQVARRTARRTGRREGLREDAWDAID